MKLSKKLFFVPAVALAFGLVSCGDNTYNANDTISSPEVYVGTDASGVNFIKVNPVKDAGSYSIYRRLEGQDSWDSVGNGQSVADSQWYFEADKTYQYKVVANAAANQGNLKSAETTKNVKTVKEFVANAPLAAEAISVALKEGFTNTAVLSIKTNPASKYKYYVVKDVSLGAEAAISSVSESGSFNGIDCAYVKGGKIVAGEYRGEVTLDNNISEDTDYYVVVKETAVSALKPATNYVISAKVTGTPNAVSVKNVAVARVNPTAAVVTFDVDAVAGKAPEAKYEVYRNATKKNGDVTGYEKLGEAAAYNKPGYVSTDDVTTIFYQFKDEKVAKVDDKEVTKYNYVVVATAYGKSSQFGTNVDLTVADVSSETATATAVDPTVLKSFSVTQKDTSTSVSGTTTTDGGKEVVITAMINKDVPATGFKVLYGEFDTMAEAKKATLAQLTKDVALDKFGADTVVLNVEKVTTDGAVTKVPEVSYSTYKKASFTLDAGSKTDKTVTYVTPETGSSTSSTVTTVTNKGKYYVFRLVVTHGGKEYVSTKNVYLTTKTTTTSTKSGDADPTSTTEVRNTVTSF